MDGDLIDWPVHVHCGERSGKPWLVIVRELGNHSLVVRLTWDGGGLVSVSHLGTACCCLGLPLGFVIVRCKWRSHLLVGLLGPRPRPGLELICWWQPLVWLWFRHDGVVLDDLGHQLTFLFVVIWRSCPPWQGVVVLGRSLLDRASFSYFLNAEELFSSFDI